MKTRDRMVLAIVGCAAAAAAFWFLALAPKRERASDLSAQVTAAEERRDVALAKAASAERARARYGRDYATVARLGKAVPPKADVPSLVYQIETAAKAAKVDFRKVLVTDVAEGGAPASAPASAPAAGANAAGTSSGITPTPFTFTFEGGYAGLRKLLTQLDRFSRVQGGTVAVNGRLLTLDGVRLSAGRDGLPVVKAEIKASAYVAPLPPALPGQSASPAGSAATTPTTASQVTP